MREKFEGHEVRTIGVDPERAHFVTLAFKLFATGNFTLIQLAADLERRGLRSRPTLRRPAGPVSKTKLAVLLRDRYYLGFVSYQGEEFPGRHEPLTTPAIFAQVQSVLDSHSGSATRQRIHHHFLKGLLWCGACHAKGIDSRLVLQRAKGNGGEYLYYFCMGRQSHICRMSHQAVAYVEDAVDERYYSLRLPPRMAERIRGKLEETLTDEERSSQLLAAQQAAELRSLDIQEENLLDLAAGGEIPKSKIRERLAVIGDRRAALTETVASGGVQLNRGAEVIRGALKLLEDPHELYRQSDGAGRRALTQALFTRIYVEDGIVTDDVLAEPFDELLYLRRRALTRKAARNANGAPKGAVGAGVTEANLLARALSGRGSSKAAMVEVAGIEPASFVGDQGLLRAQPAVIFSAPTVTQASCRRAQLLFSVPRYPVTG